MALSNRDRIDRSLEFLRAGLTPFAIQQLHRNYGSNWLMTVQPQVNQKLEIKDNSVSWDVYTLLKIYTNPDNWHRCFKQVLGNDEKSWLFEALSARNKHAHQESFSSDDTYRALDTMERILKAVAAPDSAIEVGKLKDLLLEDRKRERARNVVRTAEKLDDSAESGLKSWREVITPHRDVISGTYQQAEFAADLDQVKRGDAKPEYQDPVEFFKRTHITSGLRNLLKNSVQRIVKNEGDPVIELQTRFGGGKTHSMLAIYHLFSSKKNPHDFAGAEELLREMDVGSFPPVNRAVIVGTGICPGQARKVDEQVHLNTLWGHMAWQLGGRDGYEMIRQSDENRTAPGSDALIKLFNQFSPCLILMDELVAYIRQTTAEKDLPAGTFDSNTTFIQNLTEAVKASENTLLVASLPQSKLEVGGDAGAEALAILEHTFRRIQTSWTPANEEESYEIIRRRLFEPLASDNIRHRDAILKVYSEFYREEKSYFPPECGELDYKTKMEQCYPIHPELFERLYQDWSTLDGFQQTRGVLRLMATVIHILWELGDPSLLIQPGTVPIDAASVRDSLTSYLEDAWKGILDKDVDGVNSLSKKIDQATATLGRNHATRRVARTIFMGSAPVSKGQKGIEDKRVFLGAAQPGHHIAVFSDALRKFQQDATYLYGDGGRYWFDTAPSVNKLARDRAQQQSEDDVMETLYHFLDKETGSGSRDDFEGVHIYRKGVEIPDEKRVRLVLLDTNSSWYQARSCPALDTAMQILAQRGNTPRQYQNTLVFLAPETGQISALKEEIKLFLGWKSVVDSIGQLELKQTQVKQARNQMESSQQAVKLKIAQTWSTCLYPLQANPGGHLSAGDWEQVRLQGTEPLPRKVCKKLKEREDLITTYNLASLNQDVERFNLFREDKHRSLQALFDDYMSYTYLPRVSGISVFLEAVNQAYQISELPPLVYAQSYDGPEEGYRGLRMDFGSETTGRFASPEGFLVVREVAQAQIDAAESEEEATIDDEEGTLPPDDGDLPPSTGGDGGGKTPPKAETAPRTFFLTKELSNLRGASEVGSILEEIVDHLEKVPGANIKLTLEVHADLPSGVDDGTIRTVSENCNVLKIDQFDFSRK
jgi:uncharacterized protein